LIAAAGADADRLFSNWRAAAQLSHPHVIRIFESGRSQLNGTPFVYLVMEYAEEDLSQILPQRPLSPAEVGDLLPPLLDALSYVHGKGLIHSRIKPSNVLAVGDQLKLSADRIAPPAVAGSERTRHDVYDAPETAAGIVSPAGDLWSVGVTVVAALTQSVPFAGEAEQGDPGLPQSIPEPFRGIARECLHLDPKRRCSVAEIQARLQPAGRSVAADPEPVPPPPRPGNRGKIVGALLAVALAVGFVVFHSRGKNVPAPHQTPAEQPPAQITPAIAPAASPATAPAVAPPVRPSIAPVQKANAAAGAVVRQVLPDVPQSARRTITGKVKVSVRVEVDPSGKVAAAKLASAGPSKYFANLALKAALRWEFSPPEKDGQPTASVWLLQFRFGQTSTQVSPEQVKR